MSIHNHSIINYCMLDLILQFQWTNYPNTHNIKNKIIVTKTMIIKILINNNANQNEEPEIH